MAVHDYVCSACGERFSASDAPEDGEPRSDGAGRPAEAQPVACPACGSGLVRELWESRLRNAPGPPRPIEELRDCVG